MKVRHTAQRNRLVDWLCCICIISSLAKRYSESSRFIYIYISIYICEFGCAFQLCIYVHMLYSMYAQSTTHIWCLTLCCCECRVVLICWLIYFEMRSKRQSPWYNTVALRLYIDMAIQLEIFVGQLLLAPRGTNICVWIFTKCGRSEQTRLIDIYDERSRGNYFFFRNKVRTSWWSQLVRKC